jgi:hypothetical protein
LGVFGVTLVAFVIYLLRSNVAPEDKATVARKCLQYLWDRNADGLMSYVSTQEAKATGLTTESLDQLFQQVVDRRLAGFAPASEISIEGGTATVIASQELRNPDGRNTFLVVHVVDGPNGPVLERFVYDCLLTVLEADLPLDPSRRPPAIGLFASVQPALRDLLPTLNQLKVRGVYVRTKSTKDPEAYSWNALLSFFEQRAGKYDPGLSKAGAQ